LSEPGIPYDASLFSGRSASEIAEHVERAIRDGALVPGQTLPTVRFLAGKLGVSPTTVNAAYRTLRQRGLVVSGGRRGTRVSTAPPVLRRIVAPIPAGIADLASGNPDRDLLPPLAAALTSIEATQLLYREKYNEPELLALAKHWFDRDGLAAAPIAVTSGAMQGLEWSLFVHLRIGDRVIVEDPCFSSVLELLSAMGMEPVPVAIDREGPRPEALKAALSKNVQAMIITPRAQNPTSAALSEERAAALRDIVSDHPDVVLIEDDPAGLISGAPTRSIRAPSTRRWTYLRSLSKALGPDLRVAVMMGDPETIGRIEGGQRVGYRWISHILQRIVVALGSPQNDALLRHAEETYTLRREALVNALAAHGIDAWGVSGVNVWIPVPQEWAVAQALRDAGWAVAVGERFRLESPPGLRVTISTLEPKDAVRFADTLAQILG
jgi:DNA-binding transcriptional MocR family regulator